MSNAARQFRHRLECCDRICLAVGKNSHCMDGWIAAKNDEIDVVEVTSWSNFFQKSSVDAILAENVWEHLSQSEGRIAARNSFQFLRPGGNLRLAVPDAFHPSQKRASLLRRRGRVQPTGPCHLYNHRSLTELFLSVGFQVKLLEFFDENGSFHSTQWDVSKGLVRRTQLFDKRNVKQPYAYTSLVLDAIKPDSHAMGWSRDASQQAGSKIPPHSGRSTTGRGEPAQHRSAA